MDNEKGFLSEFLLIVRHLMPYSVEILMPFSDYKDIDKLQLVNREHYDKLFEIQTIVAKEIILPIVKYEYQDSDPISKTRVKTFTDYFLQAIELVRKDVDFSRLVELNLDIYHHNIERIKKQQRFSEQTKQSAIDLINTLIDYTKTISIILSKGDKLLINAIHQIDFNHFTTSLYGTLLTFMCLSVIMGIKHMKTEERFSAILEAGYEYVDDLDGFIDTLDILTNPEEDKLIRNFK